MSELESSGPTPTEDEKMRLRPRTSLKPFRYEDEFCPTTPPSKLKTKKKANKSKAQTPGNVCDLNCSSSSDVITKHYKNWEKAPEHVRSVGLSAENDVYEVEKILGRQIVKKEGKKQTQYFVKWYGWGPSYNCWEPAANLTGCRKYILEFNKQERLKQCPGIKTEKEDNSPDPGPTVAPKRGRPKANPAKVKVEGTPLKTTKAKPVMKYAHGTAPIAINGFPISSDGKQQVCLKLEDDQVTLFDLDEILIKWPIRMKQLKQWGNFEGDWPEGFDINTIRLKASANANADHK